jgi:NADH dehydrogenase
MQKKAVIFGGTGFLGKILVRELAKQDYSIIVATRYRASGYDLKPCGRVGQVVSVSCDYSPESIAAVVPQDADLVVNLTGILYERKKGDFGRVHVEYAARIAKECTAKNVSRFIQLSALGIEENKSRYAQTKLKGEEEVRKEYASATFIRPSVIFGQGDNFVNKFAQLSVVLPFMPLIGGGKTKFQPVYVKDVVDVIMLAASNKICAGEVIEAVGPDVLDFKDIYKKIFAQTQRKRMMIPLPWSVSKIQAFFFGLLPNPLLTTDQVKSLRSDNVVSGKYKTMADFGIAPTAMDVILPQYLCKYKQGGMFGKINSQA